MDKLSPSASPEDAARAKDAKLADPVAEPTAPPKANRKKDATMAKGKGGFDGTREHFGLTPAKGHPSNKPADKQHGMGGPNNTLKGVGLGMAAPTPRPGKSRGR